MSVPNLKRIALRSNVIRGPKFRPTADPLPRGAGPPKFNQLEMVTTCTYRPSLVKIDARNFEFARLPQTHRQDRLQYTVPLASAQCNKQAEEVHLQDETFVAKRIICDHGS